MYGFTDTNAGTGNVSLPSEALRINGQYIEEQITGYRTLTVSGREALSPELSTFEAGARDGSVFKSRRFPARMITVKYQLIAASNAAFRDAYNKLGRILNVEDAELVFKDETDKFFIGTPSKIGEVEPGKNVVIGDFEILCADPLKYSVIEYEAEPEIGEESVLINYNGTYKSFPTLESEFYKESEINSAGASSGLTGKGDCGYVAFFDDNENIIQIGDPDEADAANVGEKSQTLIHQEFTSVNGWGTAAQGLWTVKNNGSIFPDNSTQTGSVGIKPGSFASDGSANSYYLSAASYGTGPSLWHGPSITRLIPADSGGETGAGNFLVSYKHKMCIGSAIDCVNQYGDFQVQISDANGKVIAGARVGKWESGKSGGVIFYADGKNIGSVGIDLSHWNSLTGRDESSIPTSFIRKTGSEVVFNMIGIRRSFVVPSLENAVATRVTVRFGAYSDKPALSYNGLFWLKCVKDNCNTYVDIPNKFSANDVIRADCKNGEIYLNGVSFPDLGALGNDWEGFFLKPGLNQIGFSCSDWVPAAYAPKFKVKYREAFL